MLALASSLNGLERSEFACESLARDVQTPLDRADRRRKRAAHLDQRLTLDVKRRERVAIELAEPAQAVAHLLGTLVLERLYQRGLLLNAGRLEVLRLRRHKRSPAHGAV